MAAPLIHVDGALTMCARAHSLNTAGPTLAGSGLAALEQAMRVSGRPPSGMAVGSFRPHSVSLAPSAVALKRSLHLHSALTYAGLT